MATSPRPFKQHKTESSNNPFSNKKTINLSEDLESEKREKFILWNTFFRRNIHRFIETVLGIKLYPYQIFWIWLMSQSDVFISICSRAASKSFVCSVYCLAKAILYPHSEIVIAASTIRQASLIISSKVKLLQQMSPVLANEIADIVTGQNLNMVTMKNGSTIKVVACNDGAKGERATILLCDEFILLDKKDVDSILTPFLYVRVPVFKMEEPVKYSDYPMEEPQVISISSAGFKSHWSWKYIVTTIKQMVEGKRVGFFATDYLVSIVSGIKTKMQMETEKKNSDPETFSREYENIYSGESNNAYFKHAMFNRNLKKAFYPLRQDLIVQKKNPYFIPKTQGELRVVSYDLATRKSNLNDNSVATCTRLIPTHKGYKRSIVYMESNHGKNVVAQAISLKSLFYDFQADYLVLDIAQNGIGLYDIMSSITRDEERGIEYPAWSVMEHPSIPDKVREELRDRATGLNPVQVIYPVTGTPQLNSDIAVAFRSALHRKMFDFLVSDVDAEDYLARNNKEFFESKDDISLKTWLLHPFVQINLLLQECSNLEAKITNSLVRLDEGNGRKDRYTSVSYMNWFVNDVLDKELLRAEDDGIGDWEAILGVTLVF